MEKIVLASSSPRRRELMARAGFRFEVIVSEADENIESAGQHGAKVSFEYIADLNPDYLFVVDRGAVVGGEASAQGTLNNELINSTDAAKNGNIIYLDAAVWYTATGGFTSTLKMVDEVSTAIQQ